MQPPYSTNIIFYDSEFTYLDPRKGELLSIGLVKYTGEELYLELDHTDDMDPWVVDHVLPYLHGPSYSKEIAREIIRDFIGPSKNEKDKPFLVSYVNQFDSVFWYDLFDSATDHPAFRTPIDFAAILFGFGYHPNSLGRHDFWQQFGVEGIAYGEREHNALEDAKILREVYLKFFPSAVMGGDDE